MAGKALPTNGTALTICTAPTSATAVVTTGITLMGWAGAITRVLGIFRSKSPQGAIQGGQLYYRFPLYPHY